MSATENSNATIEIRENGSYLVKGVERLMTADGRQLETKESFSLCRCGASSNKPFCDGTHKRTEFTGEREIEIPLNRTKAYDGEEVTIQDNRTICAHAAHCIEDLPAVFKKDGRPWIDPNGADIGAIATLSHKCPSGALRTLLKGERVDQTDSAPKITIQVDGPYEVRGAIQLGVDADLSPPEPTRYALCRCGASKNKPYCDGSHHNLEAGWGELTSE
ncbi:MAG: CDGSH iron-sulfur domain-containing protein [Candidatus Kapaibacterium sp.]